jgi:hypothetical protein
MQEFRIAQLSEAAMIEINRRRPPPGHITTGTAKPVVE